jgi:hypothetical protein
MGEERKVYKILVGKSMEKSHIGSLAHRWEDGIKMDIREIVWEMLSGFSWMSKGTSGGPLWIWWSSDAGATELVSR